MNDLFEKKITVISLSILLAILLWLYVITEPNAVIPKDLSLPVRLANVDALSKNNLTILDDESFNVLIKLRGNKKYLDGLNKTTVMATVDLRGIDSKGQKELLVDLSGIPAGVDVTWISSNRISLNIDNIVTGVIPVSLRIEGSTPAGMSTMTPVINPAEVTIKGAETILGLIKTAHVRIEISNRSMGINENADVWISDKQDNVIEGLDVSPRQVDVFIPIESTKSVAIDANYQIVPADGYVLNSVTISPKAVNIVGRKEILDGLTHIKTVKIEQLDARANIEEKVVLILPDGVELINKKEDIILTANIEKIADKTVETNKVGIKNLTEGIEIEMLQIYIKATVRGPESLVDAWDISNAFYIDLKDLGEGTHSLPIQYIIPDKVELKEILPNEIKITIKKMAQ
ncbi:MAG: hypothetical protein GX154_10440 [Clostridiales bacterium]|nr:hypothetical protein [Clostridiales bacterium]